MVFFCIYILQKAICPPPFFYLINHLFINQYKPMDIYFILRLLSNNTLFILLFKLLQLSPLRALFMSFWHNSNIVDFFSGFSYFMTLHNAVKLDFKDNLELRSEKWWKHICPKKPTSVCNVSNPLYNIRQREFLWNELRFGSVICNVLFLFFLSENSETMSLYMPMTITQKLFI